MFIIKQFDFSFILLFVFPMVYVYLIVCCFLQLHSFPRFLICCTKQVSRFTLCRNLLILNDFDKHFFGEVSPSMGHWKPLAFCGHHQVAFVNWFVKGITFIFWTNNTNQWRQNDIKWPFSGEPPSKKKPPYYKVGIHLPDSEC